MRLFTLGGGGGLKRFEQIWISISDAQVSFAVTPLSRSVGKLISSDRSSYSDDGLLYISAAAIFQIFTQFRGAIDITSVTLREGLAK